MSIQSFEVTIPVLNEEAGLERGAHSTLAFFQEHGMDNWRLAIADNGSEDRTPQIAESIVREFPDRARFLRLSERGVGLAIRHSWTGSEADVVGYMDVDLATDLKHLLEVQSHFTQSASQVVNGSRLLPESRVVGRKLLREITSRGLNFTMRTVLGCHFTDAMCGFKFFQRQLVLDLLDEVPVIPDWFVAAELLVRGEWRGLSVQEIGVHWTDDPNSKAKVGSLIKQNLEHIMRLRRELHA